MANAPSASLSRRTCHARRALREATQAVHERLHAHPRLTRLAEGRIERDQYVDLLLRFLRFHRAVEACLSRGPDLAPAGIDLRARRRSPQLLDDLTALGVRVPDEAAMAVCALPVPRSVPEALGYLYVTEGSRLGGRVLAKALDAVLTAASAQGRRFLSGEDRTHGQGWPEFCVVLEQAGVDRRARDAMIVAAEAAFAEFEACLDQDWQAPQGLA